MDEKGNYNADLWKDIRILMQHSLWGKTSSIDDLTRDLSHEVQEFIQACKNMDSLNIEEEAADVLMMLLCVLYSALKARNKDKKNEAVLPDRIAKRISRKLHWRYEHLYEGAEFSNIESETSDWSSAKSIERRMNLMFCSNKSCENYEKAGVESVRYSDGKFICNKCGSEIVPSSKSVLFYKYKYADEYIKNISKSLLNYVEGNEKASEELYEDYPRAFNALRRQTLDNAPMERVFILYMNSKYEIPITVIRNYLKSVYGMNPLKGDVKEVDSIELDMLGYCDLIDEENYAAKERFSKGQWDNLSQRLKSITFDVSKSIEKASSFHAKSWDNQVTHKYLIHYPDPHSRSVIECMTIFHYSGFNLRDLTVELSNMYNCIVGCRFCASGALTGKAQYMNPIDYVRQVNACLSRSGVRSISDFPNFYVSFAGIGEPSALFKSVAGGMAMIRDIYPNVQFNIATFGYRRECFQYWKEHSFPIRTLQIPLYHTNLEQLKLIVSGLPENYSFLDTLREAVRYKNNNEMCRVKVNYIPIAGINDSDVDVKRFIDALLPFRDDITVKVSYLNYTKPADENGFKSPGTERLSLINDMMNRSGLRAYVFGSERNTVLGCGQLAQDCISGDI